MKREILLILGLKVGAIVLNFTGLAALANAMSEAEFGYFGVLFSTGLLVSIPAMLGLNFSLVRYTSETTTDRCVRLALARRALGRLGSVLVMFWTLGTSAALLLEGLLPEHFGPAEASVILGFGCAYAMSEVLQSVARSFDGTVRAFIYREFGWRMSFFIIALIAVVVHDFSSTLTLCFLTVGLIAILALQFTYSELGQRPDTTAVAEVPTEWTNLWHKAPSFMLVGGLSSASQYLVVTIAGLTLTLDATAHFFTSLKVMQTLSLSVIAVNFVLTPRLRNIHNQNGAPDIRGISAVCTTSAWINLTFCLCGILGFTLIGRPLLGLFGQEYSGDLPYLLILCLAAVFNATTGPSGFVLVMFDQQRQFNIISAASMAIGAIMCILLGRLYGLEGFCWGYVSWVGIQNVGTALAALYTLQINATVIGRPMLKSLAQ